MLSYIVRRVIQMIPLLVVISMVSFIIIELPPGDYLTTYILQREQAGSKVSKAEVDRLTRRYGLNKPISVRYLNWIWNILRHGDFGRSFQRNQPVKEVISERMVLTVAVSISSLIFVWTVSIPIGIYAATHQYSFFDYVFTIVGFIGLAVPNFLLALLTMYIAYANFGIVATGLFSDQYVSAPWSLAKLVDMLKHLWLPMVVIGTAGTASLIRIMRATLLDELNKPYVITARSKGVREMKLLFKYPVRIAINPLISTVGWLLPYLISGSAIASIVLGLPTAGPMFLQALKSQDMYLAGSFVLLASVLTVVGTLISDILLAWLDPRIRYEGR